MLAEVCRLSVWSWTWRPNTDRLRPGCWTRDRDNLRGFNVVSGMLEGRNENHTDPRPEGWIRNLRTAPGDAVCFGCLVRSGDVGVLGVRKPK